MNNNENIAVWFEIPAANFDRAVNFYQTILDTQIVSMEMGGLKQGLMPHDDKTKVSGAIVSGEGYTPTEQGSVLYLNGGEDLNQVLSKVDAAGGKVLMPKTHLGEEIGHIALFKDSEGNRIGLHSMG